MASRNVRPPILCLVGDPPINRHLFQLWELTQVRLFQEAEFLLTHWRGTATSDPRPVLVVVSPPRPGTGPLASWMLTATLGYAVDTGRLHPTPMVVIDRNLSPLLRRRYELSGCGVVSPPTARDLAHWRALLRPLPHGPQASGRALPLDAVRDESATCDAILFREAAAIAYRALVTDVHEAWTVGEVKALVDSFGNGSRRPADLDRFRRLGGEQATRILLAGLEPYLTPDQYVVLQGLLAGDIHEVIGRRVYRTREWVTRSLPCLIATLTEILNQNYPGTLQGFGWTDSVMVETARSDAA